MADDRVVDALVLCLPLVRHCDTERASDIAERPSKRVRAWGRLALDETGLTPKRLDHGIVVAGFAN